MHKKLLLTKRDRLVLPVLLVCCLGVLGRASVLREKSRGITIADRVITYTRIGHVCAGCINFVVAESRPMWAKLIPVQHYAINHEIGISSAKRFNLAVGKTSWRIRAMRGNPDPDANLVDVRREHEWDMSFVCNYSGLAGVKWGLSLWDHVCNRVGEDLKGYAFADVLYFHVDRKRFFYCSQRIRHLEPCSLVNLKIMSKIAPLEVRYNGVHNGEWDSDKFKNDLPPLQGAIPLALGFIGTSWDWINMRRERHLPAVGIVSLAGRFCTAYGWLTILPWSAR